VDADALHILLVDDDEVDRMAVARVLARSGLAVRLSEAPDCTGALAALACDSFDCVFLDYRLPDGDGLMLIESIRLRGLRLPLIVLTGQGDEATAVRLMKAGASDYLPKGSLTPANLAGVLRSALRVYRAEAEAERANRQLKESEERYRTVLEGSNDGIWDWDLARGCIFVSERFCDILGGCPPNCRSHPQELRRLVHPDDRLLVRRALRAHLERDVPFHVELRMRHTSGQYRYCQCRGKVHRDEAGEPVRMAGILTDVSERRWAEEERGRLLEREQQARRMAEHALAEAEEANHSKDAFLATVTHELRTPLNPIIGWTQLLRRGGLGSQAREQALETIERNAKLQKQLIEDLLDISRIIQGKFTVTPQPIGLLPVVHSAIEAVRQLAEDKPVSLEAELVPSPLVRADPVRIQQVVWNLLTNAIKFTPSGGRVSVCLTHEGAWVRLTVADSGNGIPRAFLPYIFDRFAQADSGTTRRQGGLGLGLFIVRHIVELHGGQVEAHSDGEGQGATFVVRLPVTN